MQECSEDAFAEKTKSLLLKIREIRQDTGYSADQVLVAMLVEAVRESAEVDPKPLFDWLLGNTLPGNDLGRERWDPNFVGSRTIET